ncbi:MAG TPA: helix-turn-helix domain-containing protein [Acidocella sp.]|nr:helix-turn-helix domain-containing protein [Acidocella sp.]
MNVTGPLSEDEKQIIEDMVDKDRSYGQIAMRLNRNRAQIYRYCIVTGLRSVAPQRRTTRYMRGKTLVIPFTDADDETMLALRRRGEKFTAIAKTITDMSGIPRVPGSVRHRLLSLASAEMAA